MSERRKARWASVRVFFLDSDHLVCPLYKFFIMSYQPTEQLLHDRVNLTRLLRRLEKTVASQEWEEETRHPARTTWIKTKGLLQVCYTCTLDFSRYSDMNM